MVDAALIRAEIPGLPSGMGSKRAVVRGGKAWVVDDSKGLRPWQALAIDAMQRARGERAPADVAVRVWVWIYVPRPKSHYYGGTRAGELRPDAPKRPPSGRDTDKVLRATLDSGSAAGWWRDDARVCSVRLDRYYCGRDETARMTVAMETLDG